MSNEKNFTNEQILQDVRLRQQHEITANQTFKNHFKFLICQLNDEWFGIDATLIREISRIGTVTRVPNTPAYVLGVVNLRGNITAAIDIRELLGLERRPLNTHATGRIVVCEIEGVQAGIVVEAVSEVADFNQNMIEPPLLSLGAERALYSSGVVHYHNQLLFLLNLAIVLEKLKA